MKKLLLGAVGLVALGMAVPAVAADLAARPYTKAPPVIAALYDWSGLYVGINGGWGSSHKCWDATAFPFTGPEGCHDATGGVVGGQAGYRWQNGAFVFGVEAQGDWANLRGSNQSTLIPAFTNRSRIDGFGLFTGQLGYAFNTALLYVKGGAAVTADRFDVISTPSGALAGTTAGQTRWGGVVGTGIEFSFAPNWSAAVEYDHLFMGTKDTTFTDVTFGGLFGADRIRQDADLVTARVNYRFGWGAPVKAKY
jgi:outer membrane immunogenic protein